MARLQAGEEDALSEWFATYAPPLYRFIWRLMGDATAADVEDVLQDTLLAALRTLDRFRGDCSLRTWLCAIARHKVQDHIRRQQRSRKRLSPGSLDDLSEVAGGVSSVEAQVGQQLALEQALRTLPEDYRAVLVGKYMEGFTVGELARVMGRSEKSVESLLTRARVTLRERLVGARPT